MRYASSIVGLPVVSFATGQQFEKVRDLIFDEEANQVLALLTDTAALFSSARVIRFENIRSVGQDAIVVADASVEVTADSDARISEALKRGTSVKGKTVMTEDGKNLGKITDLELDELTGKVIGYQASGGIFADMYKGKPVIPAPVTCKVGMDVVFVPNSTVELMEAQVGGLKAAGQNVADKAGDLKDQAVAKGQDLAGTAQEKAGDLKASATSPQAHDTLDSAKEKATGFLDKMKEGAIELKDQASQKVEENKIKGALGRPTNRVILDGSDQVILNTGDLITNEAVQKSREAGVLDVLLSSVHTQEPQLSVDDMKAHAPQPEEGSAAAHI